MNTTTTLSIILCNLLFSIVSHANDQTYDQLIQCKQIADDSKRLMCFDQIETDTETKPENLPAQANNPTLKTSAFPALIADLDESNIVISYGTLDFLGYEKKAVLLGGGLRQPIRSFNWIDGRPLSLNVFGQIRSQFDVDELDTRNNRGGALINTDFTVGGELVQSLDHWNWRFSYSHRSSHLGDEFLIDNQNYLQDRINISYEAIKWTAHKTINSWDFYAGLGLITRSEPSSLDKSLWQFGWQYQGKGWNNIKPIWAVDLKTWGAFDWNLNVNMRAGIEVSNWTDSPFMLLFEYHDGHAPYGQFYTEDLTFTGLTFLQNW